MLTIALLMGFGYLAGGLPTAYVLGRRLWGVDIRMLGSRNIGTINAYKQLGWHVGTVVLIIDAGKGAAVMLAARALDIGDWGMFGVAIAATAGNNWSPYLRLSGGKGLAIVFGISLAMVPLLSLAALPVVAVSFAITRGVVWAMGVGIVALNVMVGLSDEPASVLATCIVLGWIVFFTHFGRSLPEIKDAIKQRDFRLFGRVE